MVTYIPLRTFICGLSCVIHSISFTCAHVHPHTGVRSFAGAFKSIVPKLGMVSEDLFRETDNDIKYVTCITNNASEGDGQKDGLWCQSASHENMVTT